eukprot:SAG31_NODE_4121_length_3562_cov_5.914525_3_plen_76_part_00
MRVQVSPTLVIKAAARENAAWVHGASTEEEAIDAAQNVRDVFYVRTPRWQESVMTRGLAAMQSGVTALSRGPEVF